MLCRYFCLPTPKPPFLHPLFLASELLFGLFNLLFYQPILRCYTARSDEVSAFRNSFPLNELNTLGIKNNVTPSWIKLFSIPHFDPNSPKPSRPCRIYTLVGTFHRYEHLFTFQLSSEWLSTALPNVWKLKQGAWSTMGMIMWLILYSVITGQLPPGQGSCVPDRTSATVAWCHVITRRWGGAWWVNVTLLNISVVLVTRAKGDLVKLSWTLTLWSWMHSRPRLRLQISFWGFITWSVKRVRLNKTPIPEFVHENHGKGNNCFSIYNTSLIAIPKKLLHFLMKWVSRDIFFTRKPPGGE